MRSSARESQGQQQLMPQTMGFMSQMELGHHPYSVGMMSAPPNFAMSPAYAGQPVVSPIIFPAYPMTAGAYMAPMPPAFQQQAQQQGKAGDIGALSDRMGEMRFRDGGVGSREHYGGHGGDDLYGGSDRVFASGMQQNYHGHHAGGMQRGDRDFQRGGRGSGNGRQQNRGGQQALHQPRRNQKGMEEKIKRTIYISSIDLKVTEAELANFFSDCGRVVDCRICGDPNLAMRFAFIEFQAYEGVQKALGKSGVMLMDLPLRILPSKTAILPVSKELMPRSQEDIERCSRTVYVANIDKKVNKEDVRSFFEELCGKVSQLRLLGDYAHPTRIAFVEFVMAEGAMAALHCSGALLGALPLRVSPSKTPVRSDVGNGNDEHGGRHGRQQARREQQQQQQQQESNGAEQAPTSSESNAAPSEQPADEQQQQVAEQEAEPAEDAEGGQEPAEVPLKST